MSYVVQHSVDAVVVKAVKKAVFLPPTLSTTFAADSSNRDAVMERNTCSPKPIFLVTHPRSISTAFERVFINREKDFVCVHEPFSDAYHWGPEKLSERYEDIERLREEKGYGAYTYQKALHLINEAMIHGKRVLVKDMAKCLMPLAGDAPSLAPSLRSQEDGVWNEREGLRDQVRFLNPTVIPRELLSRFHFTFLIRSPRQSIPSLYKCTIPPKSFVTGWHGFKSSDAGYKELRRLFEYLININQIGPFTGNEICIIDAEDLLACPTRTVAGFCASVGLTFNSGSLHWGTEQDQKRAREVFKNWAPFHDVVLQSTSLETKPPKITTLEADLAEWAKMYGDDAAALIQKNVEDNMDDYLFLKNFAMKPKRG